jgi:cyanophycinase-like exopeptidase
MTRIDAELLASTGRVRPRVAIVPTAAWPDGEDAVERCAAQGIEYFRSLGAEVEPVLVRDRGSADDPGFVQAIGEADLVYLAGGSPGYLVRTLVGTAVGQTVAAAHARGAVLAGCAAGAMALAEHAFEGRLPRAPWPLRWLNGLGVVPGVSIVADYDTRSEVFAALIAFQAPRDGVVLGIDAGTVLVGRDGTWQVHGSARVTVWHGRRRERFRAGEVFRL